MKKVLSVFLIVMVFVSFSFKCTKVRANEKTLKNACDEIVGFIEENIKTFKMEYNKLNEDTFEANYIEDYCIVYVIDYEKYGVYLDFNDDKGYLVTSFDFDLYEIETKGDIDYLKNVEFTYYSSVDGFLNHNGEKYERYEQTPKAQEIVYGYNGQDEPGDGYIYDIDAYMADRYSSYSLAAVYEDAEVPYIPTDMFDTSLYVKKVSKDGGYNYDYIQSEGNCALTACFNIFNSWEQMGFYTGFPTKSSQMDFSEKIKEDVNYEKYGTGVGGVGIDSYWTTNTGLSSIFELYERLYYYVTTYRDYTPESGLTTASSKDIIIFGTSYFGGGTIYPTTSTNFSDVMSSLEKGRAVFMGISNSQTFSTGHAVAFLGYRKYTYKSGVWIFSSTKTAYFYMIDDGHTGGVSYFDPNCNSKVSFEFIYTE